MEVRLLCNSNVDGRDLSFAGCSIGFSQVGLEILGEEGHHDQSMLEGGGFGRFVCILGGKEE